MLCSPQTPALHSEVQSVGAEQQQFSSHIAGRRCIAANAENVSTATTGAHGVGHARVSIGALKGSVPSCT